LYGTFLPFKHCNAFADPEAEGVADAFVVLDGFTLPWQLPKPDWHPVLQYADVLPHQPLLEQQSPNPDPAHVDPPLLPQVPSGETFFVGVEAAAADDRVEVRTTKVELAGFDEDPALLPVHEPNLDWHPEPQWSLEEPH
jgi:hypothetical protein